MNTMEEYLNGTGRYRLLNVKQWGAKLKRFGDTKKMVDTLELQAYEIISGNILY